MIPLRQFRRLLYISTVLARYRLDEVLEATHLFRPIRVIRLLAPWGRRRVRNAPLGQRIRLALQDLGPIFVKFGQVLSTRRDLLPPGIADELAKLQDQVPPFPGELAVTAVESSLGQPIDELFAHFDLTPLASASVAQVHAARLTDGRAVVVKVLRPGIEPQIRRDIELIQTIASMAQRYWGPSKRMRPLDIAAELEKSIFNELDLQREAANASQLRRNFEQSDELYVPEIHWPMCHDQVLVMEQVSGLPVDDLDRLNAAGVDIRKLAERGMRIFYTQVFRDNFFHADMHPGNILVDASDPADPTYIALDFGIVGTLPPAHLYYLAENFSAFFNQDYYRVAALHIEAGWVPAQVRIDELESAVRTVCEPQFAKPLAEISFAAVLFQLFAVARRFSLIIQPELVLLQKTLLNIEGLGRHLYPQLDIWATTKPILEDILKQRHGLDAAARDLRQRLPSWMERTPAVPGLIYDYLKQATSGELRLNMQNPELVRIRHDIRNSQRRHVFAVFAAGLAISASVMLAVEPTTLTLANLPLPAMVLGGLAMVAAWRAWPRR